MIHIYISNNLKMIYLLFEDILIFIFILIFQIEHEMIVSKFFKRQIGSKNKKKY